MRIGFVVILILVSLVVVGCNSVQSAPSAPTPTATAILPTPSSTPSPTPVPTATPTATPAPSPSIAEQLQAQIAMLQAQLNSMQQPTAIPTPTLPVGVQLMQTVGPAIVRINTNRTRGTGFLCQCGQKSAVVITAYHVVYDMPPWAIQIEAKDGVIKGLARIRRFDKEADLAELELKEPLEGISPLLLAIADPVQGSPIAVVGYAYGEEQSIISGMVSVISKKETRIDAPVINGNSGGPLLNFKGEVIGVVIARRDYGIGVAVPLRSFREFLETAVPPKPSTLEVKVSSLSEDGIVLYLRANGEEGLDLDSLGLNLEVPRGVRGELNATFDQSTAKYLWIDERSSFSADLYFRDGEFTIRSEWTEVRIRFKGGEKDRVGITLLPGRIQSTGIISGAKVRSKDMISQWLVPSQPTPQPTPWGKG